MYNGEDIDTERPYRITLHLAIRFCYAPIIPFRW